MIPFFNFNVEKMTSFAEEKIKSFVKNHKSEVFYAFAIDDGLLCLNSLTEFEKTLNSYQNKYNEYNKTEEIDGLKYNTGDWEYQGFATLNEAPGYNLRLYNKFYNLGFNGGTDDALKKTKYYIAMNEIIKNLKNNQAFNSIQTSDNFKTFVVIGND